MLFNDLLKSAVERGSSDLHLHVGLPAMIRLSGKLVPLNEVKITPRATESLIDMMCNPKQKAHFEDKHQVDLAYSVSGLGRFRVNLFLQRGSVSAVLRVINSDEQALSIVSLPQDAIEYFRDQEKGMVLVTGPTGSGKSFTTFSVLKRIAVPEVNVTTVEDPVEY
ncbi:MAG TPA: ATPase, T2SS/T4P/T4SS family, partial [Trueperaceae bacterium]|nr:ATPase, T2SS/T4P/T4SS family [Trueperaceae bacterium]